MQTILRLLLLSVCTTAISCVGAKKMSQAKERLNSIKQSQGAETQQVKQIAATSGNKLKDNKIDSIINSRFSFKVDKINVQLDSVSNEILLLDSLMANKKDFRKAYKKIIIPQLALLDSFRQANAARNQVYLMLEDGVNTATYTLFNMAAFFGPGIYAIPPEKEVEADNLFSPLIDSVIKFSEKHKNFSQTATLVILGFADATGFDPESPLYAELAGLIGKPEVSKQELNKKLSELRAETLIKQLKNQFIKRLGGKEETDLLKIEYIGSGKGEQYPFKNKTDYRDDDERRRIVLCYWAVLPR